MDDYEEAVLFTYALLEERLDRIEYVLSGANKKQGEEKPKTFPERVQRIERSLQELSKKTALLNVAQDLISNHSAILSQAQSPGKEKEDNTNDAGLDDVQKAALVVERAPVFATTASQLKALDDQQIPETDGFSKLAKLRPRIAEAEDRHLQQAMKISLLRKQSGLLVQRKRHVLLVGQGRCFVEYQKRLSESEKLVRRAEFKKKQLEEGD